MKRILLSALMCMILANGSPAISGELKITPVEGNPYEYHFDWSDCTLDDALRGLHKRFGLGCIALQLPNEQFARPAKFQNLPDTIAGSFAVGLKRDTHYVGSINVFYPYRLNAVSTASFETLSKLLKSLTPEQLDINLASDGIPYKSLTSAQQLQVRQMAAVEQNIGAIFPEPVFTQKLEQSKLILALKARIAFQFSNSGTLAKSDMSCSTNADTALWRPWAVGQQEAWKLSKAAQTEPGADAPGTGDAIKLSGVYSLGKLIKSVQEGCSTPIKLNPGYEPLRISAYCETTKAGLARALALASGGEWKKTDTEWRLQVSPLTKMVVAYEPNLSDQFKRSELLRPFIRQLVKTGKFKAIADTEWMAPNLAKTMSQLGPIDLSRLNAKQMEFLNKGYEVFKKSTRTKPPATIAEVDEVTWSPIFAVFVATENTILYRGGASYE